MNPLLIFLGHFVGSGQRSSSRTAGFLMGKGGVPVVTLPSLFFPSLICCLSLRCNSQPRPRRAACYTYCPAGIHCLQLVHSHVFDSTRTCVCTNQLAHFCECARVSGCKCLQNHHFYGRVLQSARKCPPQKKKKKKKKKRKKKQHEKSQVRTSLIIKNNLSIYSAGPGAGSAETPKQEKKKKSNAVLTRRERKICLYNPPVWACQLSAGCWSCGNESVLDSPLPRITQTPQSSNQTHNPRHRKPF